MLMHSRTHAKCHSAVSFIIGETLAVPAADCFFFIVMTFAVTCASATILHRQVAVFVVAPHQFTCDAFAILISTMSAE